MTQEKFEAVTKQAALVGSIQLTTETDIPAIEETETISEQMVFFALGKVVESFLGGN